MNIKDGQEFLEKLDSLDPALVEAASREPEKIPRRGLNFGTWIAVAACLCVLCLPVLLRRLYRPSVEPEGAYTTGAGAETSHQLPIEEDSPETAKIVGDGGVSSTIDGIVESAEGAVESMPVDFSIEETVLDETGETYERTVFGQEYIDSFPDGMPAEEYFKYNTFHPQNPDGPGLSDEYLESDFGVQYYYQEELLREEACPELENYELRAFAEFDSGELPSRLCFQWDRQDDLIDTITVNILEQAEEAAPIDQEGLREYIIENHETIIRRDGVEVTALGCGNTEKTLSFWKEGRYYRIYGGSTTSETMVQLLDWLLGFDIQGFTKGNASKYSSLQDIPDAFAGYYPTDPKWVPKADKSILLERTDSEAVSLELSYWEHADGHLITYWMVGVPEYAQREMRYSNLDSYLPDIREDEFKIYLMGMQSAGKRYVSFWWDENVKAVFWYREGATANELWEFMEYLQSDEVKTERRIGDIIDLEPYQ